MFLRWEAPDFQPYTRRDPQNLAFKARLMCGTGFHERVLCPSFVTFPGVTPANAFSPLIGTNSKPKTQFHPSLASWSFLRSQQFRLCVIFRIPVDFCFRNLLGLVVYFLSPVPFIYFFWVGCFYSEELATQL